MLRGSRMGSEFMHNRFAASSHTSSLTQDGAGVHTVLEELLPQALVGERRNVKRLRLHLLRPPGRLL